MFTGLVAERGRVVEAPPTPTPGGARLVVEHSASVASRLSTGASLAVSGVCLTVVEQGGLEPGEATSAGPRACNWSLFELSPETLSRTTLGELEVGAEVNLEPALRAGDPLGGHWVQGHVDATTGVARVRSFGDHRVVGFDLPTELGAGIVLKGSIAIDGVSLTIAALDERTFDVALIPHTLEVTTLGALMPGDRVNVEGDVLARYVEKSVEAAVEAALAAKLPPAER